MFDEIASKLNDLELRIKSSQIEDIAAYEELVDIDEELSRVIEEELPCEDFAVTIYGLRWHIRELVEKVNPLHPAF